MPESKQISHAKALLAEVRGKSLAVEERRDKAVQLAAWLVVESRQRLTSMERSIQAQLAGMMQDELGKAFTLSMTDQCFRSRSYRRVADQLVFLLRKYGVPFFLPFEKRLKMWLFRFLGRWAPWAFVPAASFLVRREAYRVIVAGEWDRLAKHLKKRGKQGLRVNLNHLGEAILGEEEAEGRLEQYLASLSREDVDYVSVKISSIYSQINLLAWDATLDALAEKMRRLYRAAMAHQPPKFVNLDMEEFRDLHLTVALFKKVLEEPEFQHFSAGIVLQSYLPDSYLVQQDLTVWAMKRVAHGGAPIKIRLVKGANLAMEKVESALGGWAQAPYESKVEVDANYKRMLAYAAHPEHVQAAHVGVGSHNLFDIAYAMLLREENGLKEGFNFEMLEGMADHMRRVVQELTGTMVLYTPTAKYEDFQTAVTYLIRRLDENTGKENFLRHSFSLEPQTPVWSEQEAIFKEGCRLIGSVASSSRRDQSRYRQFSAAAFEGDFFNDPHTDWSHDINRRWVRELLSRWRAKPIQEIPLVLAGEQRLDPTVEGEGPSEPGRTLYRYTLAGKEEIETCLACAVGAKERWAQKSVGERIILALNVAEKLGERRADLIGVMVMDAGKTVVEADAEVSEAVDFANYYAHQLKGWASRPEITLRPKGVALVTPPWNFPCAIPLGGIIGALLTGNAVIFKPAPEAVWVAWELVQVLWEAGVPKEVLQFVVCEDEPCGSLLIRDERVDFVILTGATETAQLFLKMRPGLDLMAETGGKNALIATAMADRDLVVRDLIYSAFGHSGQKCSAASLGILEGEIYDNERFRAQLVDAAKSLARGPSWDLKTKVNPLIREPNEVLQKGLTHLEEGEEWLLEPQADPENPRLWSPGIKIGVTPESFTYKNELFGPVLSLMRVKNLDEGIRLANGTGYGLTSGLQSLDEREQARWIEKIEAGNLYINRHITGAIVARQPFGGMKKSAFGRGAKAGGPNYLLSMVHVESNGGGDEIGEVPSSIQRFISSCRDPRVERDVRNYGLWWQRYFSKREDVSQLVGQDNFLTYRPRKEIWVRVQGGDDPADILRIMGAALVVGAGIDLSVEEGLLASLGSLKALPGIRLKEESEADFAERFLDTASGSVRLLSPASESLASQLAAEGRLLLVDPVLAWGRVELLHFLHEVAISTDYHRYGNLGDRENEERTPLAQPAQKAVKEDESGTNTTL